MRENLNLYILDSKLLIKHQQYLLIMNLFYFLLLFFLLTQNLKHLQELKFSYFFAIEAFSLLNISYQSFSLAFAINGAVSGFDPSINIFFLLFFQS